MKLDDILLDIHALEDEMRTYERKYNLLTATFYEAYARGEEPPDGYPLRDWMAWSSAYEMYKDRREKYETMIHALQKQLPTFTDLIQKTARHESISIAG